MPFMNTQSAARLAILAALMACGFAAHGGGDVPTKASNIGGIVNTRHNLTQSFLGAGNVIMDITRNQYGEVCVYCHTPHGANTSIAAPLWNRTNKTNTYTLYNSVTLTQTVGQPGTNSLTCLSCHDGTVGIDSVINMPGSGGYNPNANRDTVQNNVFLTTWVNPSALASTHVGMDIAGTGCTLCHSASGTGAIMTLATSFDAFAISTDLTNDHPVGVTYPATGPDVDFNATTAASGSIAFFDNGNGKLDPADVRLYNTGGGYEVECASCHDPHGVPSAGAGSVNIRSFLRKSNDGSALCLTCHSK